MSYYEEDDLNIWQDAQVHHPLPEEYEAALLNEPQVAERLAAGEDPVALSIEKWSAIERVLVYLESKNLPYHYYNSLMPYIGIRTCALCVAAIQRHERSVGPLQNRGDKCKLCEFAKIDRCIDGGSTFTLFVGILDQGLAFIRAKNSATDPAKVAGQLKVLQTACRRMLSNLRRLQ